MREDIDYYVTLSGFYFSYKTFKAFKKCDESSPIRYDGNMQLFVTLVLHLPIKAFRRLWSAPERKYWCFIMFAFVILPLSLLLYVTLIRFLIAIVIKMIDVFAIEVFIVGFISLWIKILLFVLHKLFYVYERTAKKCTGVFSRLKYAMLFRFFFKEEGANEQACHISNQRRP